MLASGFPHSMPQQWLSSASYLETGRFVVSVASRYLNTLAGTDITFLDSASSVRTESAVLIYRPHKREMRRRCREEVGAPLPRICEQSLEKGLERTKPICFSCRHSARLQAYPLALWYLKPRPCVILGWILNVFSAIQPACKHTPAPRSLAPSHSVGPRSVAPR